MNPASPKSAWLMTLTVSAILLAGIIGYSIFSVARAMRSGEQAEGKAPAPNTEAPAATTPDAAAMAAPAPAAGSSHAVAQEFESIRQKEQGRKELIDNLRQQARENPDDPGTLSKERIDALEKSGDSLM